MSIFFFLIMTIYRCLNVSCNLENSLSHRWYLKAQQINPKNGRPYNQLALLAHYAVRIYLQITHNSITHFYASFLLNNAIVLSETKTGCCVLLHAVSYVVESFPFCQGEFDCALRREQEEGKRAHKTCIANLFVFILTFNNLLIFFCRQYLHYVSKF